MNEEEVVSPANYNTGAFEDIAFKRGIEEVLKDIRMYLTKEELLCLSLYKNSKRQRNDIHRVFLKKYFGKDVTSPAITLTKKRMFEVLRCVGEMHRYKKETAMDSILRSLLTRKQYHMLLLCEQRKPISEIEHITRTRKRAIIDCVNRLKTRLKEAKNPEINQYVRLLNNVLKFSRKQKIKLF